MAGELAKHHRAAAAALASMAFCAAVKADIVTDWNVLALNATAIPPNSILQSRALAIVHASMYDAVLVVQQKGAIYATERHAPPGTSIEAAVAASAHAALVQLAPGQRPLLDAALQASLAKVPDGQAKADGIRIGAQVAEQIVQQRMDDGSATKAVFEPRATPGYYQPTPPQMAAPILPQWGHVKLFALRDRSGLAFSGPPGVTSAAFARDFDEVKQVGSRYSKARTADQTAAAIFWSAQTAVPWHAVARAISAAKEFSIAENARMFALLSIATADAQIVTFEEKYKRPHWRPITAIRAAVQLEGSPLKSEPGWEPLLGTPPHPEYPSAHSSFSGAAEAVLLYFLQSEAFDVSVTLPPVVGTTRTYRRLPEVTDEVENARVWAGIHFRSACRDGTEVGRKIGQRVVREFADRAAH
jgi:hypothetical protein